MVLDESTKAFVAHSDDLHQRAGQFKSQQNDVDRRLMIVTRSETSDDALEKFDHSMQSLRKLDVAQGYMKLLTEVERLRSVNPPKAIAEYTHTNLYTALKHVATLKSLLKMLCSHTSDCKILPML